MVSNALSSIIEKALIQRHHQPFRTPADEWVSPCETSRDQDWVYWQPVAQDPPVSFRGLENAIEAPIHPDISAFYSSFWSGPIETASQEGHVSLIQLWNEDDFERLVGNLVGHYLEQRRANRNFTVFFATTEPDSELFLSIDNSSGVVFLEEPGQPPLRVIDTDLTGFLNRLEAIDSDPAIY
ncbi:MAG: SecY-interacting protein Syd [Gammaproteobacteria bacterium]|nr:SecY-interacting protein Syd [Gammaproteobacteria bacterium]MBT5204806.1 SecY-interacting protein Syd [Gammaproteobacteria bacterium]MBT5603925.1 SecY-interacting protein Syd [Gammaproteobacteria bacterium]MBT6245714.1 SecY-interacting protein Syd [Gammaproteobacteria bacterium]